MVAQMTSFAQGLRRILGRMRALKASAVLVLTLMLGIGCGNPPGSGSGAGGAVTGTGGRPALGGDSGVAGTSGLGGGGAGSTGSGGTRVDGSLGCAGAGTVAGKGTPAAIYAAGDDTCVLFPDWTLACWGDDSAGQLGDCTHTNRSVPATVPGVRTNYSFSMAAHTMCAVPEPGSGSVACWGPGPPTWVEGTVGALGVAVADDHACSYVQPSNLPGQNFCWGENSAGQLGDGTTTSSQVAVGVVGIPSNENLFVGPSFNCSALAVLDTDDLWCWGLNRSGQLGDGTTTSSARPEKLTVPSIRSMAILGQFTLASLTDGGWLCWGTGHCGDGAPSTFAHLSPTPVALPGGFGGPVGGSQGVCAELSDDRSIWCWGSNKYGQVGDGTTTERLTPTRTGFTQLPYGVFANPDGSSFYALNQYGWLYAWGRNDKGQLGDGTTTDRSTPTRVPGPSNITQLVAGAAHVCVTTFDGAVMCWGANEKGQVGDGTFVNRTSPVTITF